MMYMHVNWKEICFWSNVCWIRSWFVAFWLNLFVYPVHKLWWNWEVCCFSGVI